MKPLLSFFILLGVVFVLGARARADSGIVQFQTHDDHYAVTALVHALPLRAGPATFSFLVENRETQKPVLDAAVKLSVAPKSAAQEGEAWKASCCSIHQDPEGVVTATRGRLGNQLLYDARVILPKSGEWLLTVAVTRGDQMLLSASDELQVGAPPSPWTEHLAVLMLAPIGIGFLIVHQWRIKRPISSG